jgi:DNA-binding PadR family transcriptional regulator
MYKNDWFKGSLKTIILKLLSEHPRMYGYQITRMVEKRSDNNIQITEGALYPALHKLESQGTLISERVKMGNRVRKYYSLTSKGQTEARENIEEYFSFVRTMLLLLSNKTPTTP